MFEFGIFHEFPTRPGLSDAQSFAEGFAQVDAAEEWGIDAVWLAELHCMPDRSVMSAPLAIASAIAARTERLKIGIGVQVLPLCHPLRIAEEAATVDHISNGRLIFGVGRSGFPSIYDAYGIDYGESQERFAEVLEILRRAWTQETFSFAGAHYTFNDVHLVPKPLQQPHPPLRIAATRPDTFEAIGKLGFPIFVASRLGSLEELEPNIKLYREAYAAAGHPGSGGVYLRVPVYVAETDEQAREEPRQSFMHLFQSIGAQFGGTAAHAGVSDKAERARRGEALQSRTYEDALRQQLIVGTPDAVIRRIAELREMLGLDGILAETNSGGLIPQDRVMNSLRLMSQVAPHIK